MLKKRFTQKDSQINNKSRKQHKNSKKMARRSKQKLRTRVIQLLHTQLLPGNVPLSQSNTIQRRIQRKKPRMHCQIPRTQLCKKRDTKTKTHKPIRPPQRTKTPRPVQLRILCNKRRM